MSDRRTYSSLDDALRGEGVPEANWPTIRAVTDRIGIAAYSARAQRGIRAVREDGGPDLRIESGHTIGFVSRDEASEAAPEHEVWPNNDSRTRWGITHPVHAHRDGNGTSAVRAAAGICSECFLEKAADGSCGCP